MSGNGSSIHVSDFSKKNKKVLKKNPSSNRKSSIMTINRVIDKQNKKRRESIANIHSKKIHGQSIYNTRAEDGTKTISNINHCSMPGCSKEAFYKCDASIKLMGCFKCFPVLWKGCGRDLCIRHSKSLEELKNEEKVAIICKLDSGGEDLEDCNADGEECNLSSCERSLDRVQFIRILFMVILALLVLIPIASLPVLL